MSVIEELKSAILKDWGIVCSEQSAEKFIKIALTTLAVKLDERALEAALKAAYYEVDGDLVHSPAGYKAAIQAYLNQLINEEKE